MAHDDTNASGGGALFFAIGLVSGVALGATLGLLLAPKDGASLRKDLGERAKKLRDEASDGYRRVEEAARVAAEQGTKIAERARVAAAEGLREARRHMDSPRSPRESELAGVEGLSDSF
jgi:gas vesicle protein